MVCRAKILLGIVCVVALIWTGTFCVLLWDGRPSDDYIDAVSAVDIALRFAVPLLIIVPLNSAMVCSLYKRGSQTGKRRDSVTTTLMVLSFAFVILRGPNMVQAVVWYAPIEMASDQELERMELVLTAVIYASRCVVLLNPTVNGLVYYLTSVRSSKRIRAEPTTTGGTLTTADTSMNTRY